MLNILKFDFYKLTHSKTLKYVFLVSILLCCVNPIIIIIQNNGHSVLSYMFSINILELILLIFVPIFITIDFSNGFIKNNISYINKFYYVLSKIFYIGVYTLLMFIISFILTAFAILVINGGMLYNSYDSFPIGGWIYNRLFFLGFLFALGLLCMLVSFLIRKNYIVIGAFLIYLSFLSYPFYQLLNSIKYGITDYMLLGNLDYFSVVREWQMVWTTDYTIRLVILIVLIIFTTILSLLCFKKRGF